MKIYEAHDVTDSILNDTVTNQEEESYGFKRTEFSYIKRFYKRRN